jgi:hypothetical protein
MKLRTRLGISARRQEQISRVLQLSLVGFLFVGIYETDIGITVNAAMALAITGLPALLERDYQIPMDAGLTLWITGAVFLHAFGTVGLPGSETSFYQSVWWWDHLTHALSATLVGGAGYATARALDEHLEDLYFPPAFMFTLILAMVLAFGVLWEVLEFAINGVTTLVGSEPALTQYGVGDTMLDLVFDAGGAVIVAVWGTARLVGVSDALRDRFETA